jgi:hypothetical protein
MNQGTQGYSLMKKTEGRKSRDTVSLRRPNAKRGGGNGLTTQNPPLALPAPSHILYHWHGIRGLKLSPQHSFVPD